LIKNEIKYHFWLIKDIKNKNLSNKKIYQLGINWYIWGKDKDI